VRLRISKKLIKKDIERQSPLISRLVFFVCVLSKKDVSLFLACQFDDELIKTIKMGFVGERIKERLKKQDRKL